MHLFALARNRLLEGDGTASSMIGTLLETMIGLSGDYETLSWYSLKTPYLWKRFSRCLIAMKMLIGDKPSVCQALSRLGSDWSAVYRWPWLAYLINRGEKGRHCCRLCRVLGSLSQRVYGKIHPARSAFISNVICLLGLIGFQSLLVSSASYHFRYFYLRQEFTASHGVFRRYFMELHFDGTSWLYIDFIWSSIEMQLFQH